MKKKKQTPIQKARKKYEIVHKEEREQATKQFNTRIPSADCDKINKFLKEHHVSKVDLIYTGFMALKEMYEKNEKT